MNTDIAHVNRDMEKAKQIVIEIIRCSGGAVESKIRLFKIFYFAHLIYAKDNPDYLSEWAIVRMPMGPGIDGADRIFDALKKEGLLDVQLKSVGPYLAYEYRTVGDQLPSLSPEAIDAIRRAVEFSQNKSAAELTEIAHEFSNSWNDAKDGERLNIYVDLLTEEEYLEKKQRVQQGLADLKAISG